MKKYFIIKLFLFGFCIHVEAQTKIDSLLASIARNNKSILANIQHGEAQKMEYKTGLTPTNPVVKYDYLRGSPYSAGNQTEFTVTQEIDFPTAYSKRKQLAKLQISQIEFEQTVMRQQILLEAKNIFIKLVYHNKLQLLFNQRKQNLEKLFSDFKAKLDLGEGNMVDVNKTQLLIIEMTKEFHQNMSTIQQLNHKLTELNGGNLIFIADTIYTVFSDLPTFEKLLTEIEKSDPIRILLEQDIGLSKKHIELSKALSLPKLESGYRYQGISGQSFQGIQLGITIPLWENRNILNMQRAKLVYADLELQRHNTDHFYEVKRLFEEYSNLKNAIEFYQIFFSSSNHQTLLDKSLALGQISTIEYFVETSYFNATLINYLQIERDLNLVRSELLKFKL